MKLSSFNFQENMNFQFRKKISLFLIVFFSTLFLFYFFSLFTLTSAEPNCESPGRGDIDFCLQRIEAEINALKPAHEYNKKELSGLESQILSLEKKIAGVAGSQASAL